MIRTFQKITGILLPAQRRQALGLFLLMLLGMGLEILGVGLVLPVIVLLAEPDVSARYPEIQPALTWLGDPSQARLTVFAMLTLIGVYAVKNFYLGFLVWRQQRFALDVQVTLSQRLFAAYLHQPYTFHLQRNSAVLLRNVMGEVGQFVSKAMQPGMQIAAEGLVLAGIAILLLFVEPFGALAVAAVVGGSAWLFQRQTGARLEIWGKARKVHDRFRLQNLQQGLGGAKDVKLMGREEDFLNQFQIHNLQSARASQLHATLLQMPRLFLEFIAVLGLSALVLTMLAQGREMVAIVPAVGLFAAAAFRLMPSISRLLVAAQNLQFAGPAIDTVHEEIQLHVCPLPSPDEMADELKQQITVREVVFTYPGGEKPALRGVSLKVQRGEAVGIVGASGSGKSTLVDVVLGLLIPESGSVEIDGRNVNASLRRWQNQIGYVPQAIYLTDDTLRRNVAFGIPAAEIDDEAVAQAIRSAQLETFVASLPQGLETVVGERGVRLSGGQRQRIGIARALYHSPSVLVLDEATSALDTETEAGVMSAVAALHGEKTILIVAHRLTTVAGCDRIYRMHEGRIVAEGTPGEIL